MAKGPRTVREYPLPDGSVVKCPICSKTEFWHRRTLLNTAGASFLGFDWANREAFNLICGHCSHMLWFHDVPRLARPDE